MKLLTVLFLLVFLFPASAQAQEALLLGYRVRETSRTALPGQVGSDSLATSGYRSLLVYADAGGRFRSVSGTGLLLPAGRGFVQIGTKRSRYNRWGEDFVWAAAPGAVPEYTGIGVFNGEYCTGYRQQRILFAGGRHVAVETRTAGYCDGSASPWDFNTLAVLPLDSLDTDGADIAAVLGREGDTALLRGAESYLEKLPGSRRDAYIPEPDPANWGVVRRRGRWVAIGRLEPIEMVGAGRAADFEIPLVPPVSMAGVQGAIRWETVLQAARDAEDAFASPGGTFVAIQRPSLLTIHPVRNGRIGQAVLGQPLTSGATAVVVQWLDSRGAQAAQRVLRLSNRP